MITLSWADDNVIVDTCKAYHFSIRLLQSLSYIYYYILGVIQILVLSYLARHFGCRPVITTLGHYL